MSLVSRLRWGEALVVGLLFTLSAGCAKERGSTYRCSCSYLTDFDDSATQEVTVCSPSDERATEFARGCAQLGAPAPVEKCACKIAIQSSGCEAGACTNLPR